MLSLRRRERENDFFADDLVGHALGHGERQPGADGCA